MDSRAYTILIVDDEPLNIRILSDLLSPLYNLKVANSGTRALEIMAGKLKPDLVLLDINMPEMSGFDVCRAMKNTKDLHSIPVIFVTAVSDSGSEEEGLALGAVDYITKPIVPTVVKARVATHISLHNHQTELEYQVASRTRELTRARLELIQQLGRAAEYRDNDTGMHVIRVANYARLIGEAIGADPAWCELLYLAAPLHDIGKIGIPDGILLKPGKLDPDEWNVMKRHSEFGADIIGINHTDPMFNMAYNIALNHHESWDGSGYPVGQQGEQIPLEARITTIADVFDALLSERPYKRPWTLEEALAQIHKLSGKHLDPNLVAVFTSDENIARIKAIMNQYAD